MLEIFNHKILFGLVYPVEWFFDIHKAFLFQRVSESSWRFYKTDASNVVEKSMVIQQWHYQVFTLELKTQPVHFEVKTTILEGNENVEHLLAANSFCLPLFLSLKDQQAIVSVVRMNSFLSPAYYYHSGKFNLLSKAIRAGRRFIIIYSAIIPNISSRNVRKKNFSWNDDKKASPCKSAVRLVVLSRSK